MTWLVSRVADGHKQRRCVVGGRVLGRTLLTTHHESCPMYFQNRSPPPTTPQTEPAMASVAMSKPLMVANEAGEPVIVAKACDEASHTSLRRAATAMLLFSIVNLKHMEGWLGLVVAITVLCSSSPDLVDKARRVKCLSFVVSVLALAASFMYLCMVGAGFPAALGNEVQLRCSTIPAADFEVVYTMAESYHSMTHRALEAVAMVISPEQEYACNMLAHCITKMGSALLLLGSFLSFGLFMSAMAVAKRACRLARGGCHVQGPAVVASPLTVKEMA